jgi:acetyl-CoA carboxylase alpha subunit
VDALQPFDKVGPDELLEQRYARLRAYGRYRESA